MSTIELKEKLISTIREMDNEQLLKEIGRLLQLETKGKYLLSDKQVQIVQEAQEQIKRGDYLTEKEADKEIDEWLNEK
ncbi:MAG: hypothetical protein SH857_04495 [Chitinophagales bacterium]|nr:hypothetical protein [Chitinophagales bacterium]